MSERNVHGALKDARLLASVYLELIGGRQSKLEFDATQSTQNEIKQDSTFDINEYYSNLTKRERKRVNINEDDLMLHLDSIKNIKNNIWTKN